MLTTSLRWKHLSNIKQHWIFPRLYFVFWNSEPDLKLREFFQYIIPEISLALSDTAKIVRCKVLMTLKMVMLVFWVIMDVRPCTHPHSLAAHKTTIDNIKIISLWSVRHCIFYK